MRKQSHEEQSGIIISIKIVLQIKCPMKESLNNKKKMLLVRMVRPHDVLVSVLHLSLIIEVIYTYMTLASLQRISQVNAVFSCQIEGACK